MSRRRRASALRVSTLIDLCESLGMRRSPARLLVLHVLPLLALACGDGAGPSAETQAKDALAGPNPAPQEGEGPASAARLIASEVEETKGGGLHEPVAEPVAEPVPERTPDPEVAVGDVGLGALAGDPGMATPEGREGRMRDEPPPPLTSAEVLEVLGRVLAGGETPSDLMWRARAAEAIERDPKLGDQIVDRILAEGKTTTGREFGAMILASRGTAQGALRRLLSDPQIRLDPQYYLFVVQLLSMPHPEDETVDLVLSLRKSEDLMLHSIATKVLGGQIATLLSGGRKDAALRLAERLKTTFEGESEIAERALLLEAIGYGGLPETLPFVRGFVGAEEPELRIAAAKGLNLDDSPKGNKLLLRLTVDPDPEVQAAAIESLNWHTLSAAQQRTFYRSIMQDRVRPPNDGVLVHVIDKVLRGSARTDALEHLLARNRGSWVEGHINNVLAL